MRLAQNNRAIARAYLYDLGHINSGSAAPQSGENRTRGDQLFCRLQIRRHIAIFLQAGHILA